MGSSLLIRIAFLYVCISSFVGCQEVSQNGTVQADAYHSSLSMPMYELSDQIPQVTYQASQIPPVYVLNLDRTPERWEKAEKEMKLHGELLIVEFLIINSQILVMHKFLYPSPSMRTLHKC